MVSIAAACPAPRWHRRFMQLLPAILATARYSFRHLKGDALQDALAEVVAGSYVMFVALVRRGRESLAYGSPLAKFAIAQYNDGRRVGNRLNVGEVLSDYARQRKCFKVESLDHFDEIENQWQEAVVQDTRSAPVSDTVAFRVDFADWLDHLPRRNRRIAESLSLGHTTGDVAKRHKISGRVSQLRREFSKSWTDFTGGNAA